MSEDKVKELEFLEYLVVLREEESEREMELETVYVSVVSAVSTEVPMYESNDSADFDGSAKVDRSNDTDTGCFCVFDSIIPFDDDPMLLDATE